MRVQPFVAAVAVMQLVAGLYSAVRGDWKMAVVNLALGIANAVFATMK